MELSSVSLVLFLSTTLSFQVGKTISQKHFNALNLMNKIQAADSRSHWFIDAFARNLLGNYRIEFEKYHDSDLSLIVEEITVDHILSCS